MRYPRSGTDFSSALITNPFLTPATLAMNLWPDGHDMWLPERHLVYASTRIANTIAKGNGRLGISMPPRHGKTRLITETTIPYFIENFPGRHVMLLTYNQEYADEIGGKLKDVILAREDLFSFRIRRDRSRVEQFETNTGNIVRFMGMDTGQTGKGAHFIVIDDYLKGIDQALSPTERERMWAKFLANIYTRMEPGCTLIIMATRWHSDDLLGRVLKHAKDKFEYICFPAICDTETDDLNRVRGEALFPSRYPVEVLEEIKRLNTGTVFFEALYQQRPVDNMTKFSDGSWLKLIDPSNAWLEHLTEVRAWDFAKTRDGGDPTCGTRCGRNGLARQFFVRNVIKKHMSPMEIEDVIRRTAVADGPEVKVLLEIEPGSQSAGLLAHYQLNVLKGFDVIGVPAGNKSKLIKAQPLLAAAESGNVFLEQGEWNTEYRDNFGAFPPPSGHGDEEVDTTAMCYNYLFQVDLHQPVWGRRVEGVDDPEMRAEYQRKNPSVDALFQPIVNASNLRSPVRGPVWGANRRRAIGGVSDARTLKVNG